MAALGERIVAAVWRSMLGHGATTLALYQSLGVPVLDLTTGFSTTPMTETSLEMLFSRYDRLEQGERPAVAGEEYAYVPKQSLATPPTTRDRIVRDGVPWEIVEMAERGNGALLRFRIRRAAGAPG